MTALNRIYAITVLKNTEKYCKNLYISLTHAYNNEKQIRSQLINPIYNNKDAWNKVDNQWTSSQKIDQLAKKILDYHKLLNTTFKEVSQQKKRITAPIVHNELINNPNLESRYQECLQNIDNYQNYLLRLLEHNRQHILVVKNRADQVADWMTWPDSPLT
ncbi:MAG TPA: hypothetical protein VLE95_05915 [Chlamydiales bacterium]|nr:hypothetical protein [Chlamydiales bacterium]